MSELFARITKDDVNQIIPSVKKVIKLLYNESKLTRVNAIRSLIISIDELVNEWLQADRDILESEIKSKKSLSNVLLKRYLDNYTAIILLLIDSISTLDVHQKKKLLGDILQTLDKADDKQKKIIL